jgi:hypothetical protein
MRKYLILLLSCFLITACGKSKIEVEDLNTICFKISERACDNAFRYKKYKNKEALALSFKQCDSIIYGRCDDAIGTAIHIKFNLYFWTKQYKQALDEIEKLKNRDDIFWPANFPGPTYCKLLIQTFWAHDRGEIEERNYYIKQNIAFMDACFDSYNGVKYADIKKNLKEVGLEDAEIHHVKKDYSSLVTYYSIKSLLYKKEDLLEEIKNIKVEKPLKDFYSLEDYIKKLDTNLYWKVENLF